MSDMPYFTVSICRCTVPINDFTYGKPAVIQSAMPLSNQPCFLMI